jgi:hypothetical protein
MSNEQKRNADAIYCYCLEFTSIYIIVIILIIVLFGGCSAYKSVKPAALTPTWKQPYDNPTNAPEGHWACPAGTRQVKGDSRDPYRPVVCEVKP